MDFLQIVFSDRSEPLDVGLPNEWVWDIIDEFMYQFTQFSTYRARADKLQNYELSLLRSEDSVMACTLQTSIVSWLKFPIYELVFLIGLEREHRHEHLAETGAKERDPRAAGGLQCRRSVVPVIFLSFPGQVSFFLIHFFIGDPNAKVRTGDFADHPMYKMLGYYSLISLMRLHCLLGDYYSALKVLENVELGKKVRHVASLWFTF